MRYVLIRADSGGGTHELLEWLTAKSRRLHYFVGMTVTEDIQAAILQVPASAWTPTHNDDIEVRDGAWVADITGPWDLDGWPAGMRVIARKERSHPGAQLRFIDIDGHRFTCFAGPCLQVYFGHYQQGSRIVSSILADSGRQRRPLSAQWSRPMWFGACSVLARMRRYGLVAAVIIWYCSWHVRGISSLVQP